MIHLFHLPLRVWPVTQQDYACYYASDWWDELTDTMICDKLNVVTIDYSLIFMEALLHFSSEQNTI